MTEPFVASSFETDRLLFREVSYPDGCDMPPHEHDIDCLVLMLGGTMTGALGGEEYEAAGSSLLFMPAWRPHSTRCHGAVRTFDVVLSSEYSDEYREFLPRSARPAADAAASLATRMHHELQQRDRATPLILAGLTLELLGRMARPAVAQMRRPPWLRKVVDFIHDNLSAAVSLDDVAAAAGVHPAHLTRVFRAHYGCTIGEYSRRLRLDRACAALANSDRSLGELAFEAGFSDASHFARAFKAYTGLTPGHYRRMAGVQLPSHEMQL